MYQSAPPPTHKHQRCLCVGGGAKASMIGTGGQKSEQPHVNLKIKVGALKVPKQVLFQEGNLILDWHVLPCSAMWSYALWNVKCLELCKFLCGNEWIQIVLKLFVALKAWLPGALHFIKVPTTHTQAPKVLVWGGGAKASMMGTGGQKSEQHLLTWKSIFFP